MSKIKRVMNTALLQYSVLKPERSALAPDPSSVIVSEDNPEVLHHEANTPNRKTL